MARITYRVSRIARKWRAVGAAGIIAVLVAAGCTSAWGPGKSIRYHMACPYTYYYDPVWSPDGQRMAYVMRSYLPDFINEDAVYAMSPLGKSPSQIYKANILGGLTWSPGSKILVADYYPRSMNPDGSDIRDVPVSDAYYAAWSPDEKHIVYTSNADPHGESVHVVDLDGTHLRYIGGAYQPVWSPDGSRFVFAYDAVISPSQVSPLQVYVMNVDGSQVIRLTNGPYNNSSPTWSPDGSKIAFISDREGSKGDVYIMLTDGNQQTRLTIIGGVKSGPSWSPDGKQIAFVSDYAGLDEIYTINVDGTGLTQLTHNPSGGICPH